MTNHSVCVCVTFHPVLSTTLSDNWFNMLTSESIDTEQDDSPLQNHLLKTLIIIISCDLLTVK